MSSHHSNTKNTHAPIPEGQRRNPSRQSRASVLSGPKRINAEYRASSALSAPEIPPITNVQPTAGVQSPQATRASSVPGAYEQSVADDTTFSHRPFQGYRSVTLETLTDVEEPTIRRADPGDTFSSPPQMAGRPSPLPIPQFEILNPSTYGMAGPSSPRPRTPEEYVRHRLTGTHIRRQPVAGFSGVHLVGGSTTTRSSSVTSLASEAIVPIYNPLNRPPTAEGMVRAPSGGIEPAVPAYPGPPPQQIPQGNPMAPQQFFRLALEGLENNLRNEITARTAPIPDLRLAVNGIRDTTGWLQGRMDTIIDCINAQDGNIRTIVQNTELTQGNIRGLRTDIHEINEHINRIQTQVDTIRRTQEEHTLTQNNILASIQQNTERLKTLNAVSHP